MNSAVDLDALIGGRVSVRQHVGERDGRPLYADAVGELAADADGLVVHTRRGPVPVRRDRVVAARAVGAPRPPRAPLASVIRLEQLCARAWPSLVDEPLGAWRLRAADEYTGRANSALALGDPGLPIPRALDAVRAFADRHGIRARVQVPTGTPWDRAVADEGWVLEYDHAAGAEVAVLVAALSDLTDRPVPEPVEITGTPPAGWWAQPPSPARRHVETGGPDTAFAGCAHGRMRLCVVDDHLHLGLLWVDPDARGRGVATGLLAAAAQWGLDRGARWGALQVAEHNAAALALYRGLGAMRHHGYRYLVPPG